MNSVLKLAAAASFFFMVASFMVIVAGPQLAKAFHRHIASLKAKPVNGIFVFFFVCICVAYGSVKPPINPDAPVVKYNYDYEVLEDGSISLFDISPVPKGVLYLPSEIDGKLVTEIADEFLSQEKAQTVTSVVIPSSIVKIGTEAFTRSREYGKGINSISIEGGDNKYFSTNNGILYDKVNKRVIMGCANLKKAVIPSDCEIIDECAFFCCEDLEEVIFPKTLREIRGEAFVGCVKMKNANFSDTVIEYISQQVFAGSGLETVVFPTTLKRVGGYLFGYCEHLKDVTFRGDAPIVNIYYEEVQKNTAENFTLGALYASGDDMESDQGLYNKFLNVKTYVERDANGWREAQNNPIWNNAFGTSIVFLGEEGGGDNPDASPYVISGYGAKFYEQADDKIGLNLAAWEDWNYQYVPFWIGEGIKMAIPIEGLNRDISDQDIFLVAGSYSDYGVPQVISDEWMYQLHYSSLKSVIGRDPYKVEYGAYGWNFEDDVRGRNYSLSLDIWPEGNVVPNRQWILLEIGGEPTKGLKTFCLGIKEDNAYRSYALCASGEQFPLNQNYWPSGELVVLPWPIGAGSVMGGGVYTGGEKVMLSATPNEGWVFDGWYDANSNHCIGNSLIMGYEASSKKHHIIAKFKEREYCQVLFNVNGGFIDTASIKVEKGLSVGDLPLPRREGYTFDGWWTSLEGGDKVLATTKVIDDVTYYARWVEINDDNTPDGGDTPDGGEAEGGDTPGGGNPNGGDTPGEDNPDSGKEPDDKEETELKDEYIRGEVIDPILLDEIFDGVVSYKVNGLPGGLKFTAKAITVKPNKTTPAYDVPANAIYGTPTKSGVYRATITATFADRSKSEKIIDFIVRKSGEKVVVAECDASRGKVMGCGVYATGKKVALKATANKGYVFAGWYEDEAFTTPCDSTVVDYRTTSYSYTMGNEDKTFYARFIPVAEDTLLDLTVDGENVPTTFTVSEYAQLSLDVDSLSLPKIGVKGLPAGMKFTAKPIYKKGSKTEIEVPANTIYGAPTKPGLAEIQVSLSNQSIKKAIVKKFIIEVPNLTGANSYFVDNLDNGAGKKYVLSVGIPNIDDFLPSLELNRDVKLAVSGLPSGLKYDAKTGKITGIATKAGTYTVTLTVTDGKAKYVSTITIEVEALPDWVVGTFNGYIDGSESYAGDWVDWVTITITSSGKVSYKDITEDGSIYIVNPKDITFKQIESGDYIIETDQRGIDWYNKKELRLGFVIIDGITVGVIEGESKGADIEDGGAWIEPSIGEFYACQNVWKNAQGTKLAPTFIKNTITSVSMSRMRDDDWDSYYGGFLTLKYGANGAVTTAFGETEGGKVMATGSAQLVPYEVDGNITKAWLYTALKPKGRDAFGVLLFLSIDASNGNVYGDDVTVEDYLLEVDD